MGAGEWGKNSNCFPEKRQDLRQDQDTTRPRHDKVGDKTKQDKERKGEEKNRGEDDNT